MTLNLLGTTLAHCIASSITFFSILMLNWSQPCLLYLTYCDQDKIRSEIGYLIKVIMQTNCTFRKCWVYQCLLKKLLSSWFPVLFSSLHSLFPASWLLDADFREGFQGIYNWTKIQTFTLHGRRQIHFHCMVKLLTIFKVIVLNVRTISSTGSWWLIIFHHFRVTTYE